MPGFSGINCGDTQNNVGAFIAIGAGVLAAIIVAAIIAACLLAGGGAVAMSSAMSHDEEGGLYTNPLYEGSENSGHNPLHCDS